MYMNKLKVRSAIAATAVLLVLVSCTLLRALQLTELSTVSVVDIVSVPLKGLSTLVPGTGDFVSGNRRFCCRFTVSGDFSGSNGKFVSGSTGDFVAENGNKVACFRIQITKYLLSGTSVDRP